ncbi:MAG: SPFH domain-containing protein [Phycisphaerae bacterium]
MAITPPPPSGAAQPWREGVPQLPKIPGRVLLLGLIPLLVILGVCYWWFVQRVEVGPEEVLVLVRKVGKDLPAEAETQVILYPELLKTLDEPPDSTRYKGILYEPKPPTRYFYDPFFWERRLVKAPTIQEGEIGIKIRKYGKPLPAGKTVATEPDERGPLAEVLTPGRHYEINPLAYEVKSVKPVFIPEGHIGVQTLYAGEPAENPNRYIVEKGQRGVQPDVLPPGMYYNNPYVRRIKLIDVRSHTIDLRDEEAIRFPSNDSFEILIEGTVEYAIRQDMAPYVMTAIGDHDDIKDKIILPNAKSLSRIEGSKLVAREFISGEARAAFQKRVFEGLREQCYTQGIEIRAVLFRRIEPPGAIADPISDRQVAEQQVRQYENEINLADSQAKLVEQEEMQKQNQAIGQANREVVTLTKQAEQGKAVALTEANKRLEVAKLDLEAAKETAAALMARGEAKAEVILLDYEAQAKPLRDAISAFGGGDTYAQYFFYQKLGPALKSVLASTEGPFADIFRALSHVEGAAVDRAAAQPE